MCVCVCVYVYDVYLFYLETSVFVFTYNIHIIGNVLRVAFFTTIETKRYLFTCVCLVRIEFSDIKASRKVLVETKYYTQFRSSVIDVNSL